MAKQKSEHSGEKKGCWIFISHAGEDYEMVKKIRNEFEEQGHNPLVFYLKCLDSNTNEEEDESQKKDEEKKEHELESLLYREIEARDWFVICDSKAAEEKKYVQQEWEDINKIQREKGNKKIWTIDMSQDEESILEHVRQISKDIKVFVSYTATDWELIEPLLNELKNRDYDIEWDAGYIHQKPSDNVGYTKGKDSGIILYVFTAHSSKSEYEKLKQEINDAKENGAKIMVALIDNPAVPTDFTLLFNEISDDKKISISSTNEGYIDAVNVIDQCLAKTIEGEKERAYIRRSKSKGHFDVGIPIFLEYNIQDNNIIQVDTNKDDNEPDVLEYKNYQNSSTNQDDVTIQKYWEEAQIGNAESEYNIGRRYYDNQDYDKAIELLNMSAEKGNADAQNALGVCYYLGRGADKDENKAFELFKTAAEKGSIKAIGNLGLFYEKGDIVSKDEEKAFELYKYAAKQGVIKYQRNLGRCYLEGIGVSKDVEKAIYWYTKAGEQGDLISQERLGILYYNGSEVSKDYKQAVYWIQKAADREDEYALGVLGTCYLKGQGIPQDSYKAVECYTKAAEKGDIYAQDCLGTCYYNGDGVERDFEKAVYWYEQAAQMGDSYALTSLGLSYQNGEGVKQDYKKAIEYFSMAVDNGYEEAECNLGYCYINGYGVQQDNKKAFDLFEKASKQGNSEALYNLGVCYEKGLGVTQDIDKAIDCYSESMANGYEPAEKRLEELQKKD